jgi:hypothetical protein
MKRLQSPRFCILTVCMAGGLLLTSVNATAAELSLEQRCIAAGLPDLQEFRGYTFNHHPEKDREIRATDNFLAGAEVVSSFEAIIANLPDECDGHFHRDGVLKLQFQASLGARKWYSHRKGWEPIHWEERFLPANTRSPYPVYGPSTGPLPSPFVGFGSQQNSNSLGLGCALGGRAKIKLDIVDDSSGAIVAVRLFSYPTQVESWYRARCQGKFSIHDSAAARRCPRRIVGAWAASSPLIWGVKATRVNCGRASTLAQAALEQPSFSQGSVAAQRVSGWECFYAQRGAVSCRKRRKHVYVIARGGIGEKCSGAPKRVKALRAVKVPCELAIALAGAVQNGSAGDSGEYSLGDRSWSCVSFGFLGSDDRPTSKNHCFSHGAMVSFELAEDGRLIPAEPTTIPVEVVLPGEGTDALFTLTPELEFGEEWKWTRKSISVPVEVEPALVGQRARVEVVKFKAECTWTKDVGQTEPICPSRRRVGGSARHLTLRDSQLVYVGPGEHRGNWIYRLNVSTRPFTYNGIRYGRTSHVTWAYVINNAAHCEWNPWCHPNKM